MVKLCQFCKRPRKDWEVCCSRCWELIKLHDKLYGTNYIEQLLTYGTIITKSPSEPIVIKLQTCYYPLTVEERLARAKKIARDKCRNCPRDSCEGCIWHWLMNEILGNGK